VLEYCTGLLKAHARKPLNELVNGGVILKVLEQRRDRHPSAPEHPSSANATGVALDSGA
jgi:hypothetical protein